MKINIESDPYMTARIHDACLAFNMDNEDGAREMMREINNDKDFIIIALQMNWLTATQLKRLWK